ncbi:unnamed protein product [Protopolystoma xenopodis]|uniref:Uncharacterized protein n=1 Tax=Protopolystoma xenopodis TaxID=117903 RepID=A0A448XHR9_9PLAT|nr:unnamed protein product [Protopolystoma xenopodis]
MEPAGKVEMMKTASETAFSRPVWPVSLCCLLKCTARLNSQSKVELNPVSSRHQLRVDSLSDALAAPAPSRGHEAASSENAMHSAASSGIEHCSLRPNWCLEK